MYLTFTERKNLIIKVDRNISFCYEHNIMKKISDAIGEALETNPYLQFGFSHRLFNLTRLAGFLRPLIEGRVQNSVSNAAILMNLSRMTRRREKIIPLPKNFKFKNVVIFSDLMVLTFYKNPGVHRGIEKILNRVQSDGRFITVTEGGNEITVILEEGCRDLVKKHIPDVPKSENFSVASVGITFSEKYAETPGLIFAVIEQVTLQGINIVELSSTFTELILYVDKKDARLVFDTLFRSFSED